MNISEKKNSRDRITAFFQSVANTSFLLRFLVYANFLQFIVLVASLGLCGYLSFELKYREPLTIFVDSATGIATPLDVRVVDARGERRDELEIHYFCRQMVEHLYTYNVHTVKSNLAKVLDVCSDNAARCVLDFLKQENRGDKVTDTTQGLCDIETSSIRRTHPDLEVQVVFSKKIVSNQSTTDNSRKIATFRIKTIQRQEGNWNGLLVTEYNESNIRE